MEVWLDGWMVGRTNRLTDRSKDRQTDSEILKKLSWKRNVKLESSVLCAT